MLFVNIQENNILLRIIFHRMSVLLSFRETNQYASKSLRKAEIVKVALSFLKQSLLRDILEFEKFPIPWVNKIHLGGDIK